MFDRILKVLCSKLRLSGDFDISALAKLTPGYVGADLTSLVSEAGLLAVKRIFEEIGSQLAPETGISENLEAMEVEDSGAPDAITETNSTSEKQFSHLEGSVIGRFIKFHPNPLTEVQLEPLAITHLDFLAALKRVQPSSKREGFATVPDVEWSQVGALQSVRDELRMAIVEPVLNPELFAKVGISSPAGVLLWGPPGCGKTLLAKAVANESHANFISVKGPELLNKFVGESERAVRQVFSRARASAPCVIFFDEIDALVPRRDESKSEASSRVVNTLLTELDGLEARKSVFIIAATNRPDILDPAMLRPGRLDKLLYVELPNPIERVEILKAVTRSTPLDPSVNLHTIGTHPGSTRFSGADLASLVREASTFALREALASANQQAAEFKVSNQKLLVGESHFNQAYTKVKPSVTLADLQVYQGLQETLFGGPRS
jgi:ribosome biogenesis ATPase